MKVHHLNCGTMTPPAMVPIVAHVLLLETDGGLVLVDSGFGRQDCADPKRRLGPGRHIIRPVLRPEETAHAQVQALGLDPADVRHLVLTHLDLDHAGGLADFPAARVHVTSAEAAGAIWSPSRKERTRYRTAQFDHSPILVEHDPGGESWRGFAAAKPLDEIAPGIVMVSLPGHSRGHTAIAVDTGDGWVLHAGDAFFHRDVLDGRPTPLLLRLQEGINAHDRAVVRDNHRRLAELHARHEPDLAVFCAHDPVMLREMQDRAARSA